MKCLIVCAALFVSCFALADQSITGKLSTVILSKQMAGIDFASGSRGQNTKFQTYVLDFSYSITTTNDRIITPHCDVAWLIESPDGNREVYHAAECDDPVNLSGRLQGPLVFREVFTSLVRSGNRRGVGPAVKDSARNKTHQIGQKEDNKILDYMVRLWSGTNFLDVVTLKTDANAKVAQFPDEWMQIRQNHNRRR